jgi:hypothetical protein
VFLSLRDVGLAQIRLGMACHYKKYQHEQTTQDRLVYRAEEEGAKAARRVVEGCEASAAVGMAKGSPKHRPARRGSSPRRPRSPTAPWPGLSSLDEAEAHRLGERASAAIS